MAQEALGDMPPAAIPLIIRARRTGGESRGIPAETVVWRRYRGRLRTWWR